MEEKINKRNRNSYMSFSRQFLNDHKVEVYRGKKQILEPMSKIYDIKLPNTRYIVGDVFIEQGEPKQLKNYQMIKDLGLVVISRHCKNEERWESGQSVVYELRRGHERFSYKNINVLDHLPTSNRMQHFVEFDPYNKAARLIGPRAGPNSFSQWISTEKKKGHTKGGAKRKYKGYRNDSGEIVGNLMSKWGNYDQETEDIKIPECAFMITDSNEIVCIPKTNDMPSILISGKKRTGKSFTTHSLVSRFFWKPLFDWKVVVLNDSSRETGTWCQANQDEKQIYTLKKLGEKSLPLPMVYLHPRVKEDYTKLYMGNVGFDVTIPFEEIIDNHKDYMTIGNSAKYMTKMKDKLKECNTEEKVQQILETMTIAYQVPVNTATKIEAEFNTLFDIGMTDISYEEQEPWWTSKNPDITYNPMTTLLHAGVIPVLETEYISNFPKMLNIYFTYFVKDLFMRQKQDPLWVGEESELLIIVDEAHNISKGNAKDPIGADALLRRCVREGGPRRIGTLITTQKFGELPDVIKDNTTYMICFRNDGEASKIANQYKLGKAVEKTIAELEKFECVAFTSEYFIVYDSNGNRRKSKPNEVFIGKSLPPYSMHKKPSSKGD